MVTEPVESVSLNQMGARNKEEGKQLSSQQNYFSVAEGNVIVPSLVLQIDKPFNSNKI